MPPAWARVFVRVNCRIYRWMSVFYWFNRLQLIYRSRTIHFNIHRILARCGWRSSQDKTAISWLIVKTKQKEEKTLADFIHRLNGGCTLLTMHFRFIQSLRIRRHSIANSRMGLRFFLFITVKNDCMENCTFAMLTMTARCITSCKTIARKAFLRCNWRLDARSYAYKSDSSRCLHVCTSNACKVFSKCVKSVYGDRRHCTHDVSPACRSDLFERIESWNKIFACHTATHHYVLHRWYFDFRVRCFTPLAVSLLSSIHKKCRCERLNGRHVNASKCLHNSSNFAENIGRPTPFAFFTSARMFAKIHKRNSMRKS